MRIFLFGLLVCTFAAFTLHAQDSAVPGKLRLARKNYARGIQAIEIARNEEVKKLTRKYISVLEKVKVKYTKKGDLQSAVAVKKEIDGLKELLKNAE